MITIGNTTFDYKSRIIRTPYSNAELSEQQSIILKRFFNKKKTILSMSELYSYMVSFQETTPDKKIIVVIISMINRKLKLIKSNISIKNFHRRGWFLVIVDVPFRSIYNEPTKFNSNIESVNYDGIYSDGKTPDFPTCGVDIKNKTKYFDKKQSSVEKYSQYIDKYNALQSISGDGHVINNGTTVEEVNPSTIDTKKDNINKLREDAHSLVNNLIDFLLLMR